MDIRVKQQAKPFYLVLLRLVVMVALAIVTYSILAATGMSSDFPPLDMLYFPFVNIICGIVIWRTFRQYDTSIWAYLGFEKSRIGKRYSVGVSMADCHIYTDDHRLDGGNVFHVWC